MNLYKAGVTYLSYIKAINLALSGKDVVYHTTPKFPESYIRQCLKEVCAGFNIDFESIDGRFTFRELYGIQGINATHCIIDGVI